MAVMCAGCPFREATEQRGQLLRYIAVAPAETWPCHETDPDGLCLSDECAGRALFAEKIAPLLREEGSSNG